MVTQERKIQLVAARANWYECNRPQ